MSADALRDGCAGIAPLTARLEPWQRELCADGEALRRTLAEHGSPVNLLDVGPLARNAGELTEAGRDAGVELEVFFARKANKALSLVDEARRLGLGVDLASERELVQCLDRGVPGTALMMTAAVKPRELLDRCVTAGVTVSVDNRDELDALLASARAADAIPRLALRLAPRLSDRPPTRFGMPAAEAAALARALDPARATIAGLHFHLDGYAIADRADAIGQALPLVDEIGQAGHRPRFLDIGGGIPMSYLDSAEQWDAFWAAHRGDGDPLTFDGRPLGPVYPAHQSPVRGDWLARLLAAEVEGGTVAGALRTRGLALRCEPGRSLLDGCGLTAARVEFRKQRADGVWLVGLAMNRTQCRSAADDFLVDPLLIRGEGERTGAIEAYLVGAYCIERELLTWRRLRMPGGVAVGDTVVFPNTAGYMMHILESSSHQIPLARNLVRDPLGGLRPDSIDEPSAAHAEAGVLDSQV